MNNYAIPKGFAALSEAAPRVLQDIRYYSSYNFIGERIDGYEEPLAFLTKEAAAALSVSAALSLAKKTLEAIVVRVVG